MVMTISSEVDPTACCRRKYLYLERSALSTRSQESLGLPREVRLSPVPFDPFHLSLRVISCYVHIAAACIRIERMTTNWFSTFVGCNQSGLIKVLNKEQTKQQTKKESTNFVTSWTTESLPIIDCDPVLKKITKPTHASKSIDTMLRSGEPRGAVGLVAILCTSYNV